MQYKILCIALLLAFLAVPAMAASTCTRCGTSSTNTSCCTIAINYTFTGAAGTAALVTNVGTPSAVLLDFTIPQGADGASGGGTGVDYDAHIQTNRSQILSAELINNTAAQAAALKSADDHILSNRTNGGMLNYTVKIESDFLDASTDSVPGLLGVAISSGTVAGVATDADHPGVIYMRDSTTAAGGYRYGCSGSQLIAGSESAEFIFQTVGTRNSQTARLGWGDSTAGATLPTDGVFFNLSTIQASTTMNLSCIARSNSASFVSSGNLTPTASTWYRGTITINSAANLATCTIYSTSGAQLLQTTVAGLPTGEGRDTSPCIIASESSTDAAANILIMDYARWSVTRVLKR